MINMKKMIMPLLGLVALAGAAFSSCNTQGTQVTYNQSNALLAGNWYFYRIGNLKVQSPEEEWPHIELNTQTGQVNGNAGCNQLLGYFKFNDKGSINFADMAATRMMCPDMSVENALTEALPKVTNYSINHVTGAMAWTTAKGDTLVLLSRINPRTLANYNASY